MTSCEGEIKSFKEFEEALEKGELLCLGDVKSYVGEFTGKMIKPANDYKNDFSKFKKGDRVLVYHLDDYIKFRKALDLIKELK